MAHGFRGNQFDLRLLKGMISYKYPNSEFICSSSNEEMTDGDIEYMGVNLAKEVKSFMEAGDNSRLIGRLLN